jgi:hypothetical protein
MVNLLDNIKQVELAPALSKIAIRDVRSYDKKGKMTFRVFEHSYCLVNYNIYTVVAHCFPPSFPFSKFNLH